MGGSCINRPKKYNSTDLFIQKQIANEEYIVSIVPDIQIQLFQPSIIYPYFQPLWNLQSPSKNKIDYDFKLIKKIIDNQTNQNNNLINLLPTRFYSYSQTQTKKMFSQFIKQLSSPTTKYIQEVNGNLMYRVSLAQSLTFAPNPPLKLQLTPQTEYIILQKHPINKFQQLPDITQLFSPKLILIKQQTQNQPFLSIIIRQQLIKKQLVQLNHSYKTKLNLNCLINGLLFNKVTNNQQEQNLTKSQIRQYNQSDAPLIYELVNAFQPAQPLQKCEGLICYLNPLFQKRTKRNTKIQKYEYTSYLQFKALIEQPSLDLITLFQPQLILNSYKYQLCSIYILLLALKVFMQNHKQIKSIPIKFFIQLLTMKEGELKIITSVINLIKLFYTLVACQKQPQHSNSSYSLVIDNCCRNILQITLINSHVLLDAYFLQFGIQIDEKSFPIRQNPLLQPHQPLKYKFTITTKPNLLLITTLKSLQTKYKQKIFSPTNKPLSYPTKKQQQFQTWIKQLLQSLDSILLDQKSLKTITTLLKNKSSDLTNQPYNTNIILIMEYFFKIQLYQFIYESTLQQPNLFLLKTTSTQTFKNLSITKIWDHLIDQFMSNTVYNSCSSQLAITILTIDGLIKNMQNPNMYQQNQQSFTKALQIWLRVYRDPRAKYQPFLSNSWIIYLIKILKQLKNANTSNPQNNQDIHYLNNILQCFYCQNVYLSQKQPTSIQWILTNIPISTISGIFYSRVQLFLPPQDQINYSLLGTNNNNSLIQSLNDNLSSKSNFSDSFSNGYSDYGKTKKKNRKKVFDYIALPQSRALKNGVYQWGKSINSEPLLNPLTKNLDVYNISCGNYHVVIASSMGIYGWGQNGSGQLGDCTTKQQIKTIKLVLEKRIGSENQVQISCGNQHTAILFKEQPLVMFGQHQGGIISGKGHIFDSVTCGGLHTLGIRKGKVYSWGRGEGGQLGHKPQHLKTKVKKQSTDFYLDEPKMININHSVKKAVCGDAHSVLLTQNGDVYVFGFSYQGQLGLGITGDCQIFQVFEPVRLQLNSSKDRTTTKIVDIFAGSTFTFFKTTTGDIFSCGLNDCNQLGQQKMMKVFNKKKYILNQPSLNNHRLGQQQYSRPKRIQLFNTQIQVNKIYCGENHCLAQVQYLKKTKMIIGWGLNKQFQITNQFISDHLTPRTIDNIYDYNFHQFSCGNNFSIGFIQNSSRITMYQLFGKIDTLINNTIHFNFQYIQN